MTEAARRAFNLIDEPWIPVRFVDGTTSEASIRGAFHDAARIRELDGELPTQVFAITRLLVAILYRASYDETLPDGWFRDPDAGDDWDAWWREGLPLDTIDEYLDEFHDRFDLLHPERPFFQVAGLTTQKGELKDPSPLIFDLPGNKRLFTNRAGDAITRLSYAEAARWLVNAQAFDTSGIKSGALGDERVKGGKGYPLGVAWSGHLGGILVEGDNLARSLLANMPLPDGADFVHERHTDLPPWEDAEPDTAAARAGLMPTGPVRLATWQSRRIRLAHDGTAVTGVLVANGDALTPQNQQRHEAMTAWRFSEPQTKKAKQTVFMPREHRPERAFWRNIGAILPGQAGDGERYLPPRNLSFLAGKTRTTGDDYRLRVRAIGVVYGSQSSVVDDVIDDQIPLTLALLDTHHPELAREAVNAVELADTGVHALRNLAENLLLAAGGDPEAAHAVAPAAYAELGAAYREWLTALGTTSDATEAITAWKRVAFRLIADRGTELVAGAPSAAWVGREVSRRGSTQILNTPRAEQWFLTALTKTFGIRGPQRTDSPNAGHLPAHDLGSTEREELRT